MHRKLGTQPDGGGIAASYGWNTVRGVQRGDKASRPEPARNRGDAGDRDRHFDAALEILGAYKLTGNFHINLEIVLESLGAFDDVTFEIEPAATLPYHPDCRHVVFRPDANLPMVRFNEIIRSIEARIGFGAALPWCVDRAA